MQRTGLASTLSLAVLLLAPAAGWTQTDSPGGASSRATTPALDQLPDQGKVEKKEEEGIHSVRALLIAPRTARLSSEIQGRITDLPMSMGERFSEGDLLVGFDCARQRARHEGKEAELDRARKSLESKKKLVSLDAVSEVDVDLARSEVAIAEAQVRQTRAVLNNCRIHAPYDGRVVYIEANQFETVSPGDTLLEIVETGKLRLEAMVPSEWLRWLEEGHRFTVHVDELDQKVSARVVALGGRVDAVSQTVAIRARIEKQVPGLRPGMSGDAEFEVPD